MDLLKKYHVVIEDLASGRQEGFMIYSENNLFSVGTLQALAPKMSQGESTMGDLTNQYVFIQYNWSGHISVETRGFVGPAGIKYRSPSFNYSQLLPTGAYWYGYGVDTTSQQGEIRLGYIAQEIDSDLDPDNIMHVKAEGNNVKFIGLKNKPWVYKYEFVGGEWKLSSEIIKLENEWADASKIVSLDYSTPYSNQNTAILTIVVTDSNDSNYKIYWKFYDTSTIDNYRKFDELLYTRTGNKRYILRNDEINIQTRTQDTFNTGISSFFAGGANYEFNIGNYNRTYIAGENFSANAGCYRDCNDGKLYNGAGTYRYYAGTTNSDASAGDSISVRNDKYHIIKICGISDELYNNLIPGDYIDFYNSSGDIVQIYIDKCNNGKLSLENLYVYSVFKDGSFGNCIIVGGYKGRDIEIDSPPNCWVNGEPVSAKIEHKERAFIQGTINDHYQLGGLYKDSNGNIYKLRWAGQINNKNAIRYNSTIERAVPLTSNLEKTQLLPLNVLSDNLMDGCTTSNKYYLEVTSDSPTKFDGFQGSITLNNLKLIDVSAYYYLSLSMGKIVWAGFPENDGSKDYVPFYIVYNDSNGNLKARSFIGWYTASESNGGIVYYGNDGFDAYNQEYYDWGDKIMGSGLFTHALGLKQASYITYNDTNYKHLYTFYKDDLNSENNLFCCVYMGKDYVASETDICIFSTLANISNSGYLYGLDESNGVFMCNSYDSGNVIKIYYNSGWNVEKYKIPYTDENDKARLIGGAYYNGYYYVPNPENKTLYYLDGSTFKEGAVIDSGDVTYPFVFVLGGSLIIEGSGSKTFSFNSSIHSDKGYLVSSIYGGYLGGVNKVWTYGRVRLGKQDADYGQKVRLAISTDGGKTFYYLPRILGLPLIPDNFNGTVDSNYEYTFNDFKGLNKDLAVFFFPYGFKSTHIAYKVELYRGTAPITDFVVKIIDLYYVLDNSTEYNINLNLTLTPAQKLLDGSIEQPRDRHLQKLDFIRSIYRDRKIVKIYYPWGESVYAIPTDLINTGGFKLSAAEIEKGKKNIKEMSYFVGINFKTLPDEILIS